MDRNWVLLWLSLHMQVKPDSTVLDLVINIYFQNIWFTTANIDSLIQTCVRTARGNLQMSISQNADNEITYSGSTYRSVLNGFKYLTFEQSLK